MPLVVPGVNAPIGNTQQNWMTKLAGKKIGEKHDETNFAQNDLPKNHRIIEPGSMHTQEHDPERMNVHVDENGIVKSIRYG